MGVLGRQGRGIQGRVVVRDDTEGNFCWIRFSTGELEGELRRGGTWGGGDGGVGGNASELGDRRSGRVRLVTRWKGGVWCDGCDFDREIFTDHLLRFRSYGLWTDGDV